jgi:REP element-mobilizing transposase RayT
LCRQKEVELIEGHAMPDHIHLVLNVPPKYSIAMVLGYLKGKSAIHIHRIVQWHQARFYRETFLVSRVLRKHGRLK